MGLGGTEILSEGIVLDIAWIVLRERLEWLRENLIKYGVTILRALLYFAFLYVTTRGNSNSANSEYVVCRPLTCKDAHVLPKTAFSLSPFDLIL
jgi:hypothetical protein